MQINIENQLHKLCKEIFNGKYKIEYEDLYQQAWLYYLEYNSINKTKSALNRFIDKIKKDPLNTAISLDYLLENRYKKG